MMQASIMQGNNWMFFPIEIGLQGDRGLHESNLQHRQGRHHQDRNLPLRGDRRSDHVRNRTQDNLPANHRQPKVRLVQ